MEWPSVNGTILIVTVTFKFAEGGWVTLLVTLGFISLCYTVRSHYDGVRGQSKASTTLLSTFHFQPNLREPGAAQEPNGPTAAIIVRDFDGIAVHALLNIIAVVSQSFKNVVFISVGVVDSGQFKGHEEIEKSTQGQRRRLKSFVEFANCLGWYAEYRYSLGVDLMDELEELCTAVAKEFPKADLFLG